MPERKPTNKQKRAQTAATHAELRRVTAGSTIRIAEPPKSKKRRASKPKVVTLVSQTDDVLLNQVGGFANFIREYAVVGLAVGFIIGQQASAVMKQMVASFVDPLTNVWFGQNLSGRVAHLHHGKTPVSLPWGQFVFTIIDFFMVLIVIYLMVKFFKLDKLKKIDESK